MANERTNILSNFSNMNELSNLLMPLGVVAVLGIMILPIPAIFLDLFLSTSITISIMILLVSIYVLKPLEFSVFPSILLITTLYRLALNVASTRLILLHGNEGPDAAGKVIMAFGQFVVGGNYAVGIVVFTILVIINFIVITKGAGRIAEVSARFTLDAMPGKQMAIDADLNTGLINEDDARKRRKEIAKEADFYGAMDGASKFVRGDAVAAILITIINIVGGFVIGVMQQGMDAANAAKVYTILTVGDGLVAQIPALIVSTAAGIIVTRAASESNLGSDVMTQFFRYPKAIASAAGVLFVLGLVPGLPHFAFITLSAITGGIAYMVYQSQLKLEEEEDAAKKVQALKPEPKPIDEVPMLDALTVEIGYRLIPLVDSAQGGELLDRIKAIRKQFVNEMGFLVPPIHIKDNLQLNPAEYVVLLRGMEIARADVQPDSYMAIDPGTAQKGLAGIPTKEPAFGLPALWVTEADKEKAQLMGYTVVNASTVVATHATEVIRTHAHELLDRQETQKLIDGIQKTHPKVVEELVPNLLPLGIVQKVLQNLLKEKVSIRDMLTILEALADYAPLTKDSDALTDYARHHLGRTITKQYINPDGTLTVMTLDGKLEDTISKSVRQSPQGAYLSIEPNTAHKMLNKIKDAMEDMINQGYQSILLTSPEIRRYVKKLVERFFPTLVVLSHSELTGNVKVKTIKVVRLEDAH